MLLTKVPDLSEGEISLSESGSDVNSDCGCPEKVVLQKDSRAIFGNLENEDYFPMIARTSSQAFYGLPPKALRPTHLQMILPKISTGISSSISTTSAPRNSHNHACYINDTGDVESDALFGETILDEACMDADSTTQPQSVQSFLTGAELLGFRSNEQVSSFSKAQQHYPSSPEVEALPETLNLTEMQLPLSRSKVDAWHQKINWFTEVLMEKDKLIQDAKVTIEQLEIRDQDANGSIENLRMKIHQLRDENLKLVADRDQAQDDFNIALSLAHKAVVRYTHSATSGKREWAQSEHDSSSPERSTKNPKVADVS
jgi:hypothetical protein